MRLRLCERVVLFILLTMSLPTHSAAQANTATPGDQRETPQALIAKAGQPAAEAAV